MDIKNIKREVEVFTWTKNWEATFSLLASNLVYKAYGNHMKKFFPSKINYVFISYKKGVSSCFLADHELKKFGEDLVKEVLNNAGLLKKWADSLKMYTDELEIFFDMPSEELMSLNNINHFSEVLLDFSSHQIALKEIINHFSPEQLAKYGAVLEDARRYSEKIYPDLEKKLINKVSVAIKKDKGVPTEFAKSLLKDELFVYMEKGELPANKILERRYNTCGLMLIGEQEIVLDKEDGENIENAMLDVKFESELNGTIAQQGKATGTVRLIKDFRNVKTFNTGDILVTGMTDPHYVPLIQKAGAIVTDAGGMLCHAAIISREFKKPCIVGTKIATKVLKDGDLVEVDAYKGVVRKLK